MCFSYRKTPFISSKPPSSPKTVALVSLSDVDGHIAGHIESFMQSFDSQFEVLSNSISINIP